MKKLVLITVLFLTASFGMSTAMADTFQLKYDTVFSGTAPEGSAPWLLATFTDAGANTVTLNVSAFNLSGSEFVRSLYFNNINAPTSFSYDFTGSTAPTPGVSQGLDAYKADGDGKYDILFAFPTSGDRFTSGEVFNAALTGTGLTATSFNSLSLPAGGAGTWLAATHIKSIGTAENSGWVAGTLNTVPEPVSTVLFLVGGTTLAIRRYRKNNNKKGGKQ